MISSRLFCLPPVDCFVLVLVVFLSAEEVQSERFSRPSFQEALGIVEEHMRDCSCLALSLADVRQMMSGAIPYRLANAVRARGPALSWDRCSCCVVQ